MTSSLGPPASGSQGSIAPPAPADLTASTTPIAPAAAADDLRIALSRPAATALDRLVTARVTGRPCAPIRDLLPSDDVDAAYAVQAAWVAGRVAAGARVVGRKIGLTNPAVQAQLKVDRPDFGALLDDMDCPADKPIDVTKTLQARIEAEIAFVLARDLDGPEIDEAEVAAATAYVVAALEIVDSRIADWDITIVDTVADNAASGLFVLGAQRRELGDLVAPSEYDEAEGPTGLRPFNPVDCAMTMWRGEDVVSTGSGAACLGNPLTAVAWLAATARDYGVPLRAGEVVLSGALGPMVPIAAGDAFRAEISGLGEVSASFTAGPE
jgi:2-keto-4-pentenoate hydratase